MNTERSELSRSWAAQGRRRGAFRAARTSGTASLTESPVVAQATKNVGLAIYELLGTAELMRVAYEKGELASVQGRLSLLADEAACLAASVSEILELKKIDANPVCEQFDLVALLREAVAAARGLAGSKAVAIADVSCPGPVLLCSDPSRIRRIAAGLLSNAVKFTDRGRIALILSRDDGELSLTVADTGRGMAPEQIASVLGPSAEGWRVDHDGPAAPGLGLRLVNALVDKLDGRLAIASKPGEGTIVTVFLPFKKPA